MDKVLSCIRRQLGVIEGAMVGAQQNVADVTLASLAIIDENMDKVETVVAENARLSQINTDLETQMRRMVADQCKCDCAWRQEDGTGSPIN